MKKVFMIALCLFLVISLSSCLTVPEKKVFKVISNEKVIHKVQNEVVNEVAVKVQNSDMMEEIRLLEKVYGKPNIVMVAFSVNGKTQKIEKLEFSDDKGNKTDVYIINGVARIAFPD